MKPGGREAGGGGPAEADAYGQGRRRVALSDLVVQTRNMTTTGEAAGRVLGAAGPQDVFGPVSTDPAATRAAKRTFRRYAFLLHPDRSGDADAFRRLAELYREWTAAPTAASAPVVAGRMDSYPIGDVLARGSVGTVYRTGDAVLKIARRPASNRLLDGERAAYRSLAAMLGDNMWLRPYYPRLRDVGAIAGPDGSVRRVNVLDELTGFVTLAQVKRAYPAGLDGRDWAWMYRRLLRALAGAHLAGLVHGAVFADNVLIQPERHGVVLAGWSFATATGAPLPALVGSGRYPPEATAGRPVDGKADVHQLHTLMIDLLHPGERAQIAYARGCLAECPRMRPSAAALLDEYDDLIDRLYGARRFRPFTIHPTPTPAA